MYKCIGYFYHIESLIAVNNTEMIKGFFGLTIKVHGMLPNLEKQR